MLYHLGKIIYSKALWHFSRSEKTIYLTFDDGPHPTITPWLIDLLRKNNIKATFFCLAQNAEKHPNIIHQLLAEGHKIGNHGYEHLNGWKTNTQAYISNFTKGNAILNEIIGTAANTYLPFRPPYGKLTWSQYQFIKTQAAPILMWDIISEDYNQLLTSESIITNVTSTTKNGSVIVFHDNEKAKENLQQALPFCIDFWNRSLYNYGTL